VWAGTGENAEFSNMYSRPFTIKGTKEDVTFDSVEQAFYVAKFQYLIEWLNTYIENKDALNKVVQ
jgi:hypothetical protein